MQFNGTHHRHRYDFPTGSEHIRESYNDKKPLSNLRKNFFFTSGSYPTLFPTVNDAGKYMHQCTFGALKVALF